MIQSATFQSPFTLFAACVVALPASTQVPDPAWTKPFPPFRIAGNLYYVGSEDLASYLIVTPRATSSSTAISIRRRR